MKVKRFGWFLLALSGSMQAGIDSDSLVISFAQNSAHLYATNEGYSQSLPNEKNFRRRLYWLDMHNPHYYLLDSFQDDFDYYIAVLTDHIAVLENKVIKQKNKFKSMGILHGVGFSIFSALFGAGSYYSYTTRNNAEHWISSQEAVSSSVSLSMMTAMFAVVAGTQFYKAYRYTERLIERSDRDKRILDVLKREKTAKKLKDLMGTAK